jgi:hypothetical protein
MQPLSPYIDNAKLPETPASIKEPEPELDVD